jgi:hypothetical protein
LEAVNQKNKLPLTGSNLNELTQSLLARRTNRNDNILKQVSQLQKEKYSLTEEDKFRNNQLITLTSKNFAGQVVLQDENLVYASIFATEKNLPF